jgi:hypothetical protein
VTVTTTSSPKRKSIWINADFYFIPIL